VTAAALIGGTAGRCRRARTDQQPHRVGDVTPGDVGEVGRVALVIDARPGLGFVVAAGTIPSTSMTSAAAAARVAGNDLDGMAATITAPRGLRPTPA
jgi:hypothetical protein